MFGIDAQVHMKKQHLQMPKTHEEMSKIQHLSARTPTSKSLRWKPDPSHNWGFQTLRKGRDVSWPFFALLVRLTNGKNPSPRGCHAFLSPRSVLEGQCVPSKQLT